MTSVASENGILPFLQPAATAAEPGALVTSGQAPQSQLVALQSTAGAAPDSVTLAGDGDETSGPYGNAVASREDVAAAVGPQTTDGDARANGAGPAGGPVGGDAATDQSLRSATRDPQRGMETYAAGAGAANLGADISAPSPIPERRNVRRDDEQPEKRRRDREKRERPAQSPSSAYAIDDIIQFAGETIAVNRQDTRSLQWPF